MVNEIQKIDPVAMSPLDMMGQIIQREITSETVGVMKELVALKRTMDQDAAKVAFNRSFVAMQDDMRPIAATRVIPNKDGTIRSQYVPLPELLRAVKPILAHHGFTITTDQTLADGKTTATISLIHRDGHEIVKSFTCGTMSSPSNNPAQNDAGANTLASRVCLCNLLAIEIDYESDARMEGDTISQQEAAELERMAMASGLDVSRVLKLAGAAKFSDIKQGRYAVVLAELKKMKANERRVEVEPPPCGYADVGDWYAAMKELGSSKGVNAKGIDAAIVKRGYTSYLAVPEDARREMWTSLFQK